MRGLEGLLHARRRVKAAGCGGAIRREERVLERVCTPRLEEELLTRTHLPHVFDADEAPYV